MATSTVRQSVAATVSQWAVGNVRHTVRSPLFGAGSMPCSRRILAMASCAVLPPLSVGKMTLRLYAALNYS